MLMTVRKKVIAITQIENKFYLLYNVKLLINADIYKEIVNFLMSIVSCSIIKAN